MTARDYRAYLSQIVAAERAAGKGASLKNLAERFDIGLSSFKMILNGSRKMTMKNIHSIARTLSLSGVDREYFESLVHRDQAEDEELFSYYDQKLKQFRAQRRTETIRTSSHSILQSWYVPAFLLYLLDVEDLVNKGWDPAYLDRAAKALKIKRESLQETFAELERTGVFKQTTDSRYHFVFERVNGVLTKQRYLKEAFAVATQRMVSDFDHPLALFKSHTLSLPKAMIPALFKEYNELLEKYMSFAVVGEELEILQVCTQAIPLLKGRHLSTSRTIPADPN